MRFEHKADEVCQLNVDLKENVTTAMFAGILGQTLQNLTYLLAAMAESGILISIGIDQLAAGIEQTNTVLSKALNDAQAGASKSEIIRRYFESVKLESKDDDGDLNSFLDFINQDLDLE